MKKYLRSILETEDTKYKLEYLRIIQYYKDNPVKRASSDKILKDPSLYSEAHHIIPRWYYIYNGLELDNSEENLVRLPYFQHVKVHILLVSHFKEIGDTVNYHKALRSCKLILDANNNIKPLDQSLMDELLQLKLQDIEYQREIAKAVNSRATNPWRKYSREQIQEVFDLYEANNIRKILKKYPALKNEEYIFGFLRKRGFNATKRTYNRAYSMDELLEFANLYSRFGFQYVKKHTRYRGKLNSFLYILDRNNIDYAGKIIHRKNHRRTAEYKKQPPRIPLELLQEELATCRELGFKAAQQKFTSMPKYQNSFYRTCKRRGLI